MFGRTPRASSRPLLVAHAKQVFSLLSTAQQVELIAAFERFDLDGSGTIAVTELESVLHHLGQNPTEDMTKSIFHALDVDANGVIEWDEFSALMANRWLGQDGETDIDAAALLFADDSDPSGTMLSTQKMRELLGNHGDIKLKVDELDDLIKMADPTGSGRVSSQAFKALPCWQPPPIDEAIGIHNHAINDPSLAALEHLPDRAGSEQQR